MFVDAQAKHKDNPDTFWAPCPKELAEIKIGHFVKICHGTERFWVELTKIKGNNLEGRVDNDLVFAHPFKCDDIIKFKKLHIYDITVIP